MLPLNSIFIHVLIESCTAFQRQLLRNFTGYHVKQDCNVCQSSVTPRVNRDYWRDVDYVNECTVWGFALLGLLTFKYSVTCLTCRMTMDHTLHLFMRSDSQNSLTETGKSVKNMQRKIICHWSFFQEIFESWLELGLQPWQTLKKNSTEGAARMQKLRLLQWLHLCFNWKKTYC